MSSFLAVFPGLSIHFKQIPMFKLILKFPEKLFSRIHITFSCKLDSYFCHTSQPCMAWNIKTSWCIEVLARWTHAKHFTHHLACVIWIKFYQWQIECFFSFKKKYSQGSWLNSFLKTAAKTSKAHIKRFYENPIHKVSKGENCGEQKHDPVNPFISFRKCFGKVNLYIFSEINKIDQWVNIQ